MGADLILQNVAIREKPTAAFWNKLEKALDKKVDKMSDDELKAWADEIGMYSDSEDLRIDAHGIIRAAIDDLRNPCRDMTWITLPTHVFIDSESKTKSLAAKIAAKGLYYVYLAGGMSWGDSPGETYEDFYRLNTLFPDYIFIDEVLEE
jgi:hypothetical protein